MYTLEHLKQDIKKSVEKLKKTNTIVELASEIPEIAEAEDDGANMMGDDASDFKELSEIVWDAECIIEQKIRDSFDKYIVHNYREIDILENKRVINKDLFHDLVRDLDIDIPEFLKKTFESIGNDFMRDLKETFEDYRSDLESRLCTLQEYHLHNQENIRIHRAKIAELEGKVLAVETLIKNLGIQDYNKLKKWLDVKDSIDDLKKTLQDRIDSKQRVFDFEFDREERKLVERIKETLSELM